MARKAQLFMVDYLSPVQMPDPEGKGEMVTEQHNKRTVIAATNLLDALSHVCAANSFAMDKIIAVNRTDEIELTDELFYAK